MSMCSPAVSRTSSHARGPRPLSSTCVRPPSRTSPRSKSESGIQLLQLLGGGGLNVTVERVAVRVDADGQRPEVAHAEPPQALGHQVLPGDLLDRLDLRRLERGGAADDREVDHAVSCHGFDDFLGKAALAADGPNAVALAEWLRESGHASARGRADADGLVAALAELAHVRRGVQ